MEMPEIVARRLANQGLLRPIAGTPEAAVRWSLAVQAQDYHGAKWSLGQRLASVTDADIDALFDAGVILRTHVMRPTWHFVLPGDLRWLLALTAPRVQAASQARYRELGLDDAIRERGRETIRAAIAAHGPLTRGAIEDELAASGIDPARQRLPFLLMDAELEAVICSGPRHGKQHTYALFDDRVPPGPDRDRDDLLAELAYRYVASHGPVTPHDVSWWSGLTVRDARKGLALASDRLDHVEIDGTQWWLAPGEAPALPAGPLVHLLQPWDEYALGFHAHNPAWPADVRALQGPKGPLWNASLIAVDGIVRGGWRRKATAREVRIATILPSPLDNGHRAALNEAVDTYAAFLGVPVVIDGA